MSTLTDEQRKKIEENRLKALERRAAFLKNKANNQTSTTPFNNNSNASQGPFSNETKTINAFQNNNEKPIQWQQKPINPTVNNSNNTLSQEPFSKGLSNINVFQNDSDKPIQWRQKPINPTVNNSNASSQSQFPKGTTTNNIFQKDTNKPSQWQQNSWKSNSVDQVKPNPPGKFYSNQTSSSKDQASSSTSAGPTVFSGKKITGNFLLCSKDGFVVNMPFQAQAIEIFKTMPTKQYDFNVKKWSFNISDHSNLATALNNLRPAVLVSPLPSYVLQAIKKASSYSSPCSIDLMALDPSLLEAFMLFQREGVCFGVSRGGRVLIADDMGLGKTIQALGVAAYYRNEWPLLIVSPSSVRYSWAEAVDRWIESVDAYEVSVVNKSKDSLEGSVIIISYDLLSKRVQEIKDMNFQVVIMDESHMLKNFKSIRYKSAAPIMKNSRRLILLSGTPALSRPNELYTQLSSIDPKLIPNFQDYGIRYCAGKQQPWGWDFSGSSNMEELQILLETTIMIRRLKADVITQLPAKQRMTIILDPSSVKLNSKSMKEAAVNFKKESLKGAEKHGALIQFFNESSSAKVKAVCEYVKELLTEGDKKFLIFAHHKVMMNKISETCEELKFHYIRIDGTTSSESRQKLVDHFQASPDTRVAVLSITAASSGITLTAAHLVVFAELYWNPGLLIQAEDRVHRIGQLDSVLIQYLVAKGTADDFIWPLVQSKLNILNKVGLSKDSFKAAATAKQKGKQNEGIMKYLTEMKDEDLLTDFLDDDDDDDDIADPSSSTSFKRKRLCDGEEENEES